MPDPVPTITISIDKTATGNQVLITVPCRYCAKTRGYQFPLSVARQFAARMNQVTSEAQEGVPEGLSTSWQFDIGDKDDAGESSGNTPTP